MKFTRQRVTPPNAKGRSPCGERGLKFPAGNHWQVGKTSLPVRGAWVEIFSWPFSVFRDVCRSPCGERGLKW